MRVFRDAIVPRPLPEHQSLWQEGLAWLGKHYTRFLVTAQVIADSAAISLAVVVACALFLDANSSQVQWRSTALTAGVVAALGIGIFQRMDLYRQQVSLMNLIEIRKIVKAVFFLYLLLLVHLYFVETGYPRAVFFYAGLLTLLFTLLERMAFFKLDQLLYLQGFNVRRVLIVGAAEEGRLLCQNLHQSPKLGYQVAAFWDEDKEQLSKARCLFEQGKTGRVPAFYDQSNEIADLISSLRIDEVFISKTLTNATVDDLTRLIEFCKEAKIRIHFMPLLSSYSALEMKVDDISGIPMTSFDAVPTNALEQISKRIFDLALVILALPVLLPVFIGIGLLIRWDSAGPVLFKQTRVGKDGIHFEMFKFRSMHAEAPQYERSPKSSADPRITRLGAFLRKTSLDELPQLFNVIRGEMSLVGPRPEMPFIVETEYSALHHLRHRVKPGITGVWQISADRTREIHENISYDLFYIKHKSLLLDIIILVRTVIFAAVSMRTY